MVRKKKKSNFDENLLIPGWAGELEDDELAIILNSLRDSKRLRKKWGFKENQKVFQERKIRKIAMEGIWGYAEEA